MKAQNKSAGNEKQWLKPFRAPKQKTDNEGDLEAQI